MPCTVATSALKVVTAAANSCDGRLGCRGESGAGGMAAFPRLWPACCRRSPWARKPGSALPYKWLYEADVFSSPAARLMPTDSMAAVGCHSRLALKKTSMHVALVGDEANPQRGCSRNGRGEVLVLSLIHI